MNQNGVVPNEGSEEPSEPMADAETAAEKERAVEIYRELLSRAPENQIEPDLDRMRMISDLTGEPQRAQPIIHLTGTNGKTSTARMIEALLRELNLRTGRYTSPHLSDVRERIAIDGAPITAAKFAEVWDDLQPYLAIVDEQSEAKIGRAHV